MLVILFLNPEGALFSYTTGKDLVYMESTNNDKTTYAILKDAEGKYYIYGISMTFSWTATIIKQVYYGEIMQRILAKPLLLLSILHCLTCFMPLEGSCINTISIKRSHSRCSVMNLKRLPC